MSRLVAIHQPNFFPWLGLFDKLRRADVFIVLDDVQYPKTGGSWSNRVRALIQGEARWLTAPVDRAFHGTRKINQLHFSAREAWRERLVRSLVMAYRRAPCFEETMSALEPLLRSPVDNVAEYNIQAITALAGHIGLRAPQLLRSSAWPTELGGTDRLVELTRRVGGDGYLCGGGAQGYQQDAAFAAAGLGLVYQRFTPIAYPQHGSACFVAGLSVIDAAMNLGWSGVGTLLAGH